MAITLRKGVFETNSSSCHVITIEKGTWQKKFREGQKVYFTISQDYNAYDRHSGDILTSVADRAQYWWTTVVLNSDFRHPQRVDYLKTDVSVVDFFESKPLLSFESTKQLVRSYLNGQCEFDDPFEIVKRLDEYDVLSDVVNIDHNSNNTVCWAWRVLESKELFLDYLFGDGDVDLGGEYRCMSSVLPKHTENAVKISDYPVPRGKKTFEEYTEDFFNYLCDMQDKLTDAVIELGDDWKDEPAKEEKSAEVVLLERLCEGVEEMTKLIKALCESIGAKENED